MANDHVSWKQNLRHRIEYIKKSLNDIRDQLANKSNGKVFIEPIFRGYNVLVQMTEVERRGIRWILESLEIRGPLKVFLEKTIIDDVTGVRNGIIRLYTYGSHVDLRPDELDYIRYLDPRGLGSDEPYATGCMCGECFNSFRIEFPPALISIDIFDPPVPQSEAGEFPPVLTAIDIVPQGEADEHPPENVEPRSRSDSVDSTEALLEEMANQEDNQEQLAEGSRVDHEEQRIILNTDGTIRIRASRTPYLNNDLIVDIPEHVNNSSFVNPHGGRMSISFNMQYLHDVFTQIEEFENDAEYAEYADEDIENMNLQDVQVTLSPCCYTQSVSIVSSVQTPNALCSICLHKIESGASSFDGLCVKVRCCGQFFHDSCLRHLLCTVGPPKCPLCRADFRDVVCGAL
tara:strand:- start:3627 stop:4832 length:1206 start_codon:yes stop_codon:yes gene_type:complete